MSRRARRKPAPTGGRSAPGGRPRGPSPSAASALRAAPEAPTLGRQPASQPAGPPARASGRQGADRLPSRARREVNRLDKHSSTDCDCAGEPTTYGLDSGTLRRSERWHWRLPGLPLQVVGRGHPTLALPPRRRRQNYDTGPAVKTNTPRPPAVWRRCAVGGNRVWAEYPGRRASAVLTVLRTRALRQGSLRIRRRDLTRPSDRERARDGRERAVALYNERCQGEGMPMWRAYGDAWVHVVNGSRPSHDCSATTSSTSRSPAAGP